MPKSLIADFGMTLVLTLTNPMTILSFAGLFAGVSGLRGFPLTEIPALLLGVFVGSAVWWLALAFVIGLIRHKISPTTMLWINRGSAAAIIGVRALCAGRAAAGLCPAAGCEADDPMIGSRPLCRAALGPGQVNPENAGMPCR